MLPPLEEIQVERINKRVSKVKADKRNLKVDMNPMVDLAFLLLTFFMLATTFSKPQAMELIVPAKPKEESAEKEMAVKESKTISLFLDEEEIIWYQGVTDPETHNISYEELESLLIRLNNEIDGVVVLIKPGSNSDYGNMVTVFDDLNISGVGRYAFSPLTDFDKELDSQNE